MDFFWMKTIFGVQSSTFFWVNVFNFGCHCRIQNSFRFYFYGFQNTKPMTRNALQCNGKGSFCYGQKNIFLGSSQEKNTVTALARRGETPQTRKARAGWRTPCWRGPGCPPAHSPASSSWWSTAFILCIYFGYKSSGFGFGFICQTRWWIYTVKGLLLTRVPSLVHLPDIVLSMTWTCPWLWHSLAIR